MHLTGWCLADFGHISAALRTAFLISVVEATVSGNQLLRCGTSFNLKGRRCPKGRPGTSAADPIWNSGHSYHWSRRLKVLIDKNLLQQHESSVAAWCNTVSKQRKSYLQEPLYTPTRAHELLGWTASVTRCDSLVSNFKPTSIQST